VHEKRGRGKGGGKPRAQLVTKERKTKGKTPPRRSRFIMEIKRGGCLFESEGRSMGEGGKKNKKNKVLQKNIEGSIPHTKKKQQDKRKMRK